MFLTLQRKSTKKLQLASYCIVKDWMLSPKYQELEKDVHFRHLFNLVQEILANAKGKNAKCIHIGKEDIKLFLFIGKIVYLGTALEPLSLSRLQDIKSTYKNQWIFYIVPKNYKKPKFKKTFTIAKKQWHM